jgi:putative DNA primase/helicase
VRQIVKPKQLDEISAWIPKPDSSRNGTVSSDGKAIDLLARLTAWNFNFKGPFDFNGGATKVLGVGGDPCWFGGAHGAEACAAAQFANGAVAAWCLHESCRASGWQYLRKLHDPDYDPDRNSRAKESAQRSAPNSSAESGSKIPTLEAGAPFAIADALVAARFTLNGLRTLHHWQGSFWQWNGASYEGVSDSEIRAVIGNYLYQDIRLLKTKPNGDLLSINPTNWHTRNVFDALMARANLPAKGITPPQWLSDGEGSKSARLIAVRNGLFDLETRELYPPSPKFFNLNALDINYHDGADCRHWLHFLEQLWEQDPQSINCLQEVLGYLLEPSNAQQKIFLMIGPLRSGKGTIAHVIESILGASVVKPALTDFTSTFGLEQIIGKSLAIVPDGRLGRDANSAAAVERMLSISGGDNPSIQRKYQSAYRGPTTCRFMILTNELPALPDASGALASRIVLLRTFKSFLGNEDTTLFEAKLEPEMDGIFRWALDGWQRLRERGYFVVPDSARGLLDDFVDLSNPLSDFVNERLVREPEHIVDKEVIYSAYSEWAKAHDRKPMTRHWFFRYLGALPGVDVAYRRDEFTEQARDAQGKMVARRVKGLKLK